MASSSSSSAPAASAAATNLRPAAAGCLRPSRLSFSLIPASVKPLLLPTKGSRISRNRLSVAKAQLNEVGGLSNDGTATKSKTEAPPSKGEDVKSSMSEEEISAFMTQVASLVKLVNSRDIVELQLKQLDCELIIRKKEALQQPPATAPVMMMPPAAGQYAMAPPYSPPPPAAAPSPSSTTGPSAPAPPSAPPKAKSSHPPLKSPMAGTFYRNPGPGLAPFVKPGDKVNKGQVLCIIEAMKLMNEIEADQAGTVVEILVDDGKPVGIEQPLFVIEP